MRRQNRLSWRKDWVAVFIPCSLGVRAVKFIQAIEDRAEAVQFSKWAKKYGMRVMIHCGGTSLPDVPTTNAAGIIEVQPDVLAHLNGGPPLCLPMISIN
jgi:hypothetical protein